jgi:Domain of unknown function (DUF4382)
MKNKGLLIGLFCLSLISVSCSKEDEQSSDNLTIKARTSYVSNRLAGFRANAAVTLNSFKINLKEIEFEMDDDFSTGDGFYGDDDDIELRGPFELNLLNGTTEITSLNVPNGVYKEVEFKMARNTTSGSTMFNKSIEIKGTINGTPFEFWHNVEEDFEIDYDDTNQNIVVTDNTTTIIFDFDLNAAINSIDFSVATDGDGDGIIEINPNDNDGNQSLANLIKDRIKDSCDLDD